MPSGLKPDEIGFCRIRRLLGSCRDGPGRFRDPDWKGASTQKTKKTIWCTQQPEVDRTRKTRTFPALKSQRANCRTCSPWGLG